MALANFLSHPLGFGAVFLAVGALFGFVTAVSATFGGRRARRHCLRVGLFWGVLVALSILIEGQGLVFPYAALPVAVGAALVAYIAGGPLLDKSRHRHFPDIYPLKKGEDRHG